MTKFYVSTVELDTSTQDGRDIRDAIAKQTSMKLTGHTWQQEQAFDLANNTVGQVGNAAGGGQGGLLGSLMALSMMNNMQGSMGGGMIQPQYNQPSFGSQGGGQPTMPQAAPAMPSQAKTIYCSNCSKKRLSTERFCPHCGTEYNPCPRCGADNNKNSKRCVSCGASLTGAQGGGNICTKCGSPIAPGAAFCGVCGNPVAATNPNVCPRCGSSLPPTASFCPTCGFKR